MSNDAPRSEHFNAHQVVYLPLWARAALLTLLALLGVSAAVGGLYFLVRPDGSGHVVPLMSIAQTAIGAFAVVLFVLFAERQLSTHRLYQKTDEFLEIHLKESLSRIEIPQAAPEATAKIHITRRPGQVHGGRKDIFGCNYMLELGDYQMKFWVGINVKRLSVIYFARVTSPQDVETLKDAFRFTFSGAEKVGYHTHFEYATVGDEKIVSIWSTVFADQAILGNPAEQLFWTQDIAMMTQSVARTALRSSPSIDLMPTVDPGPL